MASLGDIYEFRIQGGYLTLVGGEDSSDENSETFEEDIETYTAQIMGGDINDMDEPPEHVSSSSEDSKFYDAGNKLEDEFDPAMFGGSSDDEPLQDFSAVQSSDDIAAAVGGKNTVDDSSSEDDSSEDIPGPDIGDLFGGSDVVGDEMISEVVGDDLAESGEVVGDNLAESGEMISDLFGGDDLTEVGGDVFTGEGILKTSTDLGELFGGVPKKKKKKNVTFQVPQEDDVFGAERTQAVPNKDYGVFKVAKINNFGNLF
jgi:hypothetical protein